MKFTQSWELFNLEGKENEMKYLRKISSTESLVLQTVNLRKVSCETKIQCETKKDQSSTKKEMIVKVESGIEANFVKDTPFTKEKTPTAPTHADQPPDHTT